MGFLLEILDGIAKELICSLVHIKSKWICYFGNDTSQLLERKSKYIWYTMMSRVKNSFYICSLFVTTLRKIIKSWVVFKNFERNKKQTKSKNKQNKTKKQDKEQKKNPTE